jgi:hypothetical protein
MELKRRAAARLGSIFLTMFCELDSNVGLVVDLRSLTPRR